MTSSLPLPAVPAGVPSAGLAADLAAWGRVLGARGLQLLPTSRAVPVDAWVRAPVGRAVGRAELLHLRARGTRVTLRSYDPADLAAVILRSECDCESHRTAGAAYRTSLVPGAVPGAEVVYDGAAEAGWTGVEAGLLRVDGAAALFEVLLPRLRAEQAALAEEAADEADHRAAVERRAEQEAVLLAELGSALSPSRPVASGR